MEDGIGSWVVRLSEFVFLFSIARTFWVNFHLDCELVPIKARVVSKEVLMTDDQKQ